MKGVLILKRMAIYQCISLSETQSIVISPSFESTEFVLKKKFHPTIHTYSAALTETFVKAKSRIKKKIDQIIENWIKNLDRIIK